MASQALVAVQIQHSAFQQVIVSTAGINNSYPFVDRTAQKQNFTNILTSAIQILSQNSQVFESDWSLFDGHVAHLIHQEMSIDSTLENTIPISNLVQRIELVTRRPLPETRKYLKTRFSFDDLIRTADLLAQGYNTLTRDQQHYHLSSIQSLFELNVTYSQQNHDTLTRFSTAIATILSCELSFDPSNANKNRLTAAVERLERASRHYFPSVPACIQPVEIRMKERKFFTKRENFLVFTGPRENLLSWPERVLDLTKLKTKEAEEAIIGLLGGDRVEIFRAKITPRNFADLYFFAIEHNLGRLKSFLQHILVIKMERHPTPPINGFQWDQDFVPFLDAFLQVAKREQESESSHFSSQEDYLAEACTLYKMFKMSDDQILALIKSCIKYPDRYEVTRKLLYCFLAVHIDVNNQVADVVKKFIIPFLFLFDCDDGNEFLLSAFEYFFLVQAFGRKDAKPTGELFKVVGLNSIQFTLDNADQKNRIKKAFQDFDLLSCFEQVILRHF